MKAILAGAMLLGLACSHTAQNGSDKAVPSTSQSTTSSKPAPQGSVLLADGKDLALASVWKDQTTVLTFYRGHF